MPRYVKGLRRTSRSALTRAYRRCANVRFSNRPFGVKCFQTIPPIQRRGQRDDLPQIGQGLEDAQGSRAKEAQREGKAGAINARQPTPVDGEVRSFLMRLRAPHYKMCQRLATSPSRYIERPKARSGDISERVASAKAWPMTASMPDVLRRVK